MIYIINFVVLFLLSMVWGKKDWFNFSFKVGFALLAGANGMYALQTFGYLVRI